jgi:hypothetical protein
MVFIGFGKGDMFLGPLLSLSSAQGYSNLLQLAYEKSTSTVLTNKAVSGMGLSTFYNVSGCFVRPHEA